jgi:hypothetical protein
LKAENIDLYLAALVEADLPAVELTVPTLQKVVNTVNAENDAAAKAITSAIKNRDADALIAGLQLTGATELTATEAATAVATADAAVAEFEAGPFATYTAALEANPTNKAAQKNLEDAKTFWRQKVVDAEAAAKVAEADISGVVAENAAAYMKALVAPESTPLTAVKLKEAVDQVNVVAAVSAVGKLDADAASKDVVDALRATYKATGADDAPVVKSNSDAYVAALASETPGSLTAAKIQETVDQVNAVTSVAAVSVALADGDSAALEAALAAPDAGVDASVAAINAAITASASADSAIVAVSTDTVLAALQAPGVGITGVNMANAALYAEAVASVDPAVVTAKVELAEAEAALEEAGGDLGSGSGDDDNSAAVELVAEKKQALVEASAISTVLTAAKMQEVVDGVNAAGDPIVAAIGDATTPATLVAALKDAQTSGAIVSANPENTGMYLAALEVAAHDPVTYAKVQSTIDAVNALAAVGDVGSAVELDDSDELLTALQATSSDVAGVVSANADAYLEALTTAATEKPLSAAKLQETVDAVNAETAISAVRAALPADDSAGATLLTALETPGSGLTNVVSENAAKYKDALKDESTVSLTSAKVQAAVDKVNAGEVGDVGNYIATAIADDEDTEYGGTTNLLAALKAYQDELGLNVVDQDNADAYLAALNSLDDKPFDFEKLQQTLDKVNAFEALSPIEQAVVAEDVEGLQVALVATGAAIADVVLENADLYLAALRVFTASKPPTKITPAKVQAEIDIVNEAVAMATVKAQVDGEGMLVALAAVGANVANLVPANADLYVAAIATTKKKPLNAAILQEIVNEVNGFAATAEIGSAIASDDSATMLSALTATGASISAVVPVNSGLYLDALAAEETAASAAASAAVAVATAELAVANVAATAAAEIAAANPNDDELAGIAAATADAVATAQDAVLAGKKLDSPLTTAKVQTTVDKVNAAADPVIVALNTAIKAEELLEVLSAAGVATAVINKNAPLYLAALASNEDKELTHAKVQATIDAVNSLVGTAVVAAATSPATVAAATAELATATAAAAAAVEAAATNPDDAELAAIAVSATDTATATAAARSEVLSAALQTPGSGVAAVVTSNVDAYDAAFAAANPTTPLATASVAEISAAIAAVDSAGLVAALAATDGAITAVEATNGDQYVAALASSSESDLTTAGVQAAVDNVNAASDPVLKAINAALTADDMLTALLSSGASVSGIVPGNAPLYLAAVASADHNPVTFDKLQETVNGVNDVVANANVIESVQDVVDQVNAVADSAVAAIGTAISAGSGAELVDALQNTSSAVVPDNADAYLTAFDAVDSAVPLTLASVQATVDVANKDVAFVAISDAVATADADQLANALLEARKATVAAAASVAAVAASVDSVHVATAARRMPTTRNVAAAAAAAATAVVVTTAGQSPVVMANAPAYLEALADSVAASEGPLTDAQVEPVIAAVNVASVTAAISDAITAAASKDVLKSLQSPGSTVTAVEPNNAADYLAAFTADDASVPLTSDEVQATVDQVNAALSPTISAISAAVKPDGLMSALTSPGSTITGVDSANAQAYLTALAPTDSTKPFTSSVVQAAVDQVNVAAALAAVGPAITDDGSAALLATLQVPGSGVSSVVAENAPLYMATLAAIDSTPPLTSSKLQQTVAEINAFATVNALNAAVSTEDQGSDSWSTDPAGEFRVLFFYHCIVKDEFKFGSVRVRYPPLL